MKDLTPKITEKTKKALSSELTDDALGDVVGGISEDWYYTFNPERDKTNYTSYPAPGTIEVPPVEVVGSVEHFCPHCIKVTVFNIPAQGADYCSVCRNVYSGPVRD